MARADWRRSGRSWLREAVEVYAAPLDLIWLLHANHMAPSVVEGALVSFDGPRSGHTHGAMAEGQGGTVTYGRGRSGRYGYTVADVDPAVPMVETIETRPLGRRWRRRITLAAVEGGTAVTERLGIERGLPFRLDLPVVEAVATRRDAAIRRWLATPEDLREPFPDNAKAPKLRSV